MIRIGFTPEQQQQVVTRYLADHDDLPITRIVVFTPKLFPFPLPSGLPADVIVQQVDYSDIIMYTTFYPLLEVIDQRTLLIFSSCLRTQNRNDLTYNCAHHYANQTPHVIVFEPFPFIEQPDDLMILLDYQRPGKYKGRGFDPAFLREEEQNDVVWQAPRFTIESIHLTPTAKDIVRYEQKKEQLFAGLGSGDPDTIPRHLHIFAGTLVKRAAIQPDQQYVARNDRFKLPNVHTYRDVLAGETQERATTDGYTIIDFPHRRVECNDFLARTGGATGRTTIRFLHSGLKVDDYYLSELHAWVERLETLRQVMGVSRETPHA